MWDLWGKVYLSYVNGQTLTPDPGNKKHSNYRYLKTGILYRIALRVVRVLFPHR